MRKSVQSLARLSLVLLATSLPAAMAQQAQPVPSPAPASPACGRAIVAGAVRSATRIQLCRRARLLEALAVAGGLSKRAEGFVQVLHADGTLESYRLKELKRSGGTGPYLRDGDVVSVR